MAEIGLMGCGLWGRNILRDLVALDCTVHVVARSEASRARAHAGGAAQVVDALARLPTVRGLVVATPTARHGRDVEAALELGVPVFVEKPMCTDRGEAERLAALAPDRLFVMDKWRYHAGVEALRDIANSGELGSVTGVTTVRHSWGNPHSLDVDDVWILAPHELAIGLEILGWLPPVRHAVGETTGDCLHGVIAVLGDRPWHALDVSGTSPVRRREIRLLCEGGTAWLSDAYADHIGVATTGQVGAHYERRAISTELPLVRELRAFVEYLDGGSPPRSSAADGRAIVDRVADLREKAASISPMASDRGTRLANRKGSAGPDLGLRH